MLSRPRRLALLAALPALLAAALVSPVVGVRGAAWFREVEEAVDVGPGRFVDGKDVAIHVMEWGPSGGETLLFVPGTSAWGRTWVEVAEPLAEAGYRVVAMDLPPFGYSERPGSADYSRQAQARRILAVADTLGEDLVLVGHSFGGGATVQAALDGGDQFRRVVLLDPALGLGMADAPIAPLFRVNPVAEVAVAGTFANPGFLPYGVRAMVADPATATPERVARYAEPLHARGTTDAIARWLPELLAPAPAPAGEPQAYAAIRAPVLVVWGAEDHITPVSQGEELVELLSNGELAVLPGVGHLPQIEDPQAVVEVLLRWMPQEGAGPPK